jgi:hypothetical protein
VRVVSTAIVAAMVCAAATIAQAGCSATDAAAAADEASDGGEPSPPVDSGPPPVDAGAPEAAVVAPPPPFVVRGEPLNAQEIAWMEFVAAEVVPYLEGTRAERVLLAGRVSWWALKEADWELPSAVGYSLCNTPSGDEDLGPLEPCSAGRAWQVGLAGVQVPGHTIDEMNAIAARLFPDRTVTSLLEDTAGLAGYPSGSTASGIVSSTGALRISWLLRVPALGFTAAEEEVVGECIEDSKSWCYGKGWDETRKFAPTREEALRAIDDVVAILSALAPP